MKNKKPKLTDSELELLSDIFHDYKDTHREIKESVRKAMDLEKKITVITGGRYEPDTTYDIK